MISQKALSIAYPQADFLSDILLRDDGNGPYVTYWNAAKLGPQPDNATLEALPEYGASDVDAERDRRLETYTFGGHTFQFDADSQTNISGAGTLALAAIINGAQPGDYRWANADADFVWLATNNDAVKMDAQTAWNFAQSAALWKQQHVYAARAIKDTSPIPANYADDSLWPTA